MNRCNSDAYLYSMHFFYKQFLVLLFGFVGWQALPAQTFDRLQFPSIPSNWSKQLFADKIQFANYNIRGENPISITMYRSVAFSGKPEAGFQQLWRQYLALADTAATPKIRKLYNNNGDMMFMGNSETDGPEGKGYYQLTVYFTDGYMQGILLNALSAKAYKPVMYEWMDRFSAVSFIKKRR